MGNDNEASRGQKRKASNSSHQGGSLQKHTITKKINFVSRAKHYIEETTSGSLKDFYETLTEEEKASLSYNTLKSWYYLRDRILALEDASSKMKEFSRIRPAVYEEAEQFLVTFLQTHEKKSKMRSSSSSSNFLSKDLLKKNVETYVAVITQNDEELKKKYENFLDNGCSNAWLQKVIERNGLENFSYSSQQRPRVETTTTKAKRQKMDLVLPLRLQGQAGPHGHGHEQSLMHEQSLLEGASMLPLHMPSQYSLHQQHQQGQTPGQLQPLPQPQALPHAHAHGLVHTNTQPHAQPQAQAQAHSHAHALVQVNNSTSGSNDMVW
jgi:hypothetical protein